MHNWEKNTPNGSNIPTKNPVNAHIIYITSLGSVSYVLLFSEEKLGCGAPFNTLKRGKSGIIFLNF